MPSDCDANWAHGDGRELELGADLFGKEDVNGGRDHVRGSWGWWAGQLDMGAGVEVCEVRAGTRGGPQSR